VTRNILCLLLAASLAACASPPAADQPGSETGAPTGVAEPTTADSGGSEEVEGELAIDGSSTVYPITEAIADDFMSEFPDAQITVAFSGTGGGFEKFCNGETQMSNASRPIKDEERAKCVAAGIDPLEIQVAYDGLAVVTNPDNDFLECVTVEQLKKIWEPAAEGTVMTWADVDAAWPTDELRLFGPGTDSGTFDYFTEVVVGETDASRADFTASEDDNVLVQGVAGDEGSLGYFGLAYYEENADKLKLISVDGGTGCVAPTSATVIDKSYALSRPLYIYVDGNHATDPLLAEFVTYFLTEGAAAAAEVGYVPLPPEDYTSQMAPFE
jgi:phosphate transport system substrate-binding protein